MEPVQSPNFCEASKKAGTIKTTMGWAWGFEGRAMARAEDYRRYAAECLALAQRAREEADRAKLLEMAHAFNELAIKAATPPDRDRD
jgi:hypothetical protein